MAKEKNPQKTSTADDFRIVGVGASAGGLEALSLLLSNTPPDADYAIVIIQHLSEKPKSMLPEILSRKTTLPIREITGNTPLLPGHVYIAPAHAYVALSKNTLKLVLRSSKGWPFLPIDFFFASLARAKKEKAVGVILSGTGRDGTEGIQAIRRNGGATFAEDPKASAHAGMPESAIASEAIMHILSPKNIAKMISAKEIKGGTSPALVRKDPLSRLSLDAKLREIIRLLERSSKIDFSAYKEGTVRRRITRRMNIQKIDSLSRYAEYLQNHPEEVELLSEDILIHVTEFFRDPGLFQSLKRKVFPALVRGREENDTIRIWIPGCSTGEEMYSFAIALIEFLERQKKNIPIQLLGTDVSEPTLKEARRGRYGKEIEAKVSPERLRRFFTKVAGEHSGGSKKYEQKYEINKAIRNMCVFAKHNMVKDTPFSRIDLVSCRNVLIYFDAELQKKAFPLFHFALKPEGFLVLGTSENVSGFHDLFREMDKKYKIYSKKATASPFRFEFTVNPHTENALSSASPKGEDAFPSGRNIEKEAEVVRAQEYEVMGEDVKVRTRELRVSNAALVKEVAMRKRLEADLLERTKKLEEADRKKNEFLAVLSHELRNPLAPIIASVETMKLRGTNDPEVRNMIDVIGRQSEHMTRLLKDLLDVSKILYDKIELSPEYADIRDVVRHATDATQFFIEKRNQTLILDVPEAPAYLLIDSLRIEQMIENLIFNASKYTNPGGKIEVIVRSEKNRDGEEEIRITIKDNGMGIAPEILPKIFDLFAQAEGVLKKTKGGIGIGLFLVRRFAMLHGGTVTVRSDGIGKGSEFTVHLPVKNNLSLPKPSPKTVPTATGGEIKKRILVADDNHDAADSLGKLLTDLGHIVRIAYGGKEALRAAKETSPDIAFVDIAMPEMDGYEVAKQIREDRAFSKTKLIALTGFGQKSDIENALRAGFDFHYVKPITLAALKEALEKSREES